MKTNLRPGPFKGTFLVIALLATVGVLAGPASAQTGAGGDAVVVPIAPADMWECTNRQNFFDYPAGKVISSTLGTDALTIGLADGIEDEFSFAVVARIDYDGGSQRAIYQIHNGVQQTGILDPTSGTPIVGTEAQVVYLGGPEISGTVKIAHTNVISATIDDLIIAAGGDIVGIAIDGQMPPIKPGDPSVYVQINTFYLPTADAVRTCGEYLIYFTPADQVEYGLADGIHDGLLCNSGVEPFSVPDGMDLTNASVTLNDIEEKLIFALEFNRVSALNLQFAGGVELYDPAVGLPPVDPDWLFNSTGNWSFNFAFTPPDQIDLFASQFVDGTWSPIENPAHNVTIEGNLLTLEIDFDQLGETFADWTWFATVTNFSVCDQIGLGDNLAPELPLPGFEEQQPPSDATMTPSPTATAIALPSATPTPTATTTATAVPDEAPAPSEDNRPGGVAQRCFGSISMIVVVAFTGNWFARRKLRS